MRVNDQMLGRLAVLKEIRRRESVSRTELTGIKGLSSATITELTADLLRRGLIVAARDGVKGPGRPRTQLAINAEASIVIGASLGEGGYVTISFMDLLGRCVFSLDVEVGEVRTLLDLAHVMTAALVQAIDASHIAANRISRVAIALPAVVDSVAGTVRLMATLPPGEVPFAKIIGDKLAVPVTIENNSACMARAEHWFGNARHLDDFTLIHVGRAMSSAEFVDGLPKATGSGLNSEIGHIKVASGSAAMPCLCGARGCLLTVASMYGLLRRAGRLSNVPFPPPDFDPEFNHLLKRDSDGDKAIVALFDEGATHLGLALANYINATAPRAVLISFLHKGFLERLRPGVLATLHDATLPGALASTSVEFVVTDNNWRGAGTSALALERTYLGA